MSAVVFFLLDDFAAVEIFFRLFFAFAHLSEGLLALLLRRSCCCGDDYGGSGRSGGLLLLLGRSGGGALRCAHRPFRSLDAGTASLSFLLLLSSSLLLSRSSCFSRARAAVQAAESSLEERAALSRAARRRERENEDEDEKEKRAVT